MEDLRGVGHGPSLPGSGQVLGRWLARRGSRWERGESALAGQQHGQGIRATGYTLRALKDLAKAG